MRKDLPILSFPAHLKVFIGYLKSLAEGNYRIEVTLCRDQRSLKQNAYLHGVLFPVVARALSEVWGEPVDMYRAKSHLKDRFLRRADARKDTGEFVGFITIGTHELDVPECGVFIEQIIEYLRDDLGVPEIPSRKEYEHLGATAPEGARP